MQNIFKLCSTEAWLFEKSLAYRQNFNQGG